MTDFGGYTTEFLRNAYWREFERRDRLNTSLSLPAGVVVLLAGIVGYYLQNLPGSRWDLWAQLFVATAALLSLLLLISVYFRILLLGSGCVK